MCQHFYKHLQIETTTMHKHYIMQPFLHFCFLFVNFKKQTQNNKEAIRKETNTIDRKLETVHKILILGIIRDIVA